MLAAKKSDFGVTGELLAEILVAVGTGNVHGSYRLIGLKDRWTAVGALQTLPSTFIYTVI